MTIMTIIMDFIINNLHQIILIPIIFTFFSPLIFVFLFYLMSFILHLYKFYYQLPIIDKSTGKNLDFNEHWKYWNQPVQTVAKLLTTVGRWWHGYDIINMNNIPDNGPAIIVFYHSTIPNDYHYLLCRIFLDKKRKIFTITDRLLFYIPGWSLLLNALQSIPGTRKDCVQLLKQNRLIALSPGGLREAMFGDNNYQLIWSGRQGFASVAKEANVPIIPVFTKNSREAFRCLPLFQEFFRKIYDQYKIPLFLPYGGLPVKMTTIIGEPIYFLPEMSVTEIAELTAKKMKELIERHQTRPGSMWKALRQRFC
ncbi:DGAT1/2-independent enzyme synthesizing storage lipids-like [Dermatophagoides pteronyssinus]|uniref:DGAT1/2-independent enzyme synthesizing storage lipids-like n=1 Tax=Dermatophagoides pteronyssinus TaxID=6956 RepID=UPI003F6745D0